MSGMNKIVVVGCSLAGLRTIEALRREGFEGEVVAIGDEDAMPLRPAPALEEVSLGGLGRREDLAHPRWQ